MAGNKSGKDRFAHLLETFERIREVFSPAGESCSGGLSLYQAEDLVGNEIRNLFNSCQSMARDILTRRIHGPFATYSHCDDMDIDNAAAEAVTGLFSHRKSVDRDGISSTGIIEIIDVVAGLYRINPDPTGKDVYFWLRKIVGNHVSHYKYGRLKEKSPEYVHTGKKIAVYIKNSSRYACDSGTVRDTIVEVENMEARMATADELVSMCGRIEPQPSTVPEAVDLVFDLLSEQTRFRSEVSLAALREAVFRCVEWKLPALPSVRQQVTPLDSLLIGRAEEAAAKSLSEITEGYPWRKGFSKSEKEAFLKAAADLLHDMIYRGGRTMSIHKYLAAHMEECPAEVYESVYKGSAQHFFKYVLERWRERVKVWNPGNQAENRKKQDAELEDGDI